MIELPMPVLQTKRTEIRMIQRTILMLILFLVSLLLMCQCTYAYQHIYVDQVNGENRPDTAGTESDSFKSITYALWTMTDRGAPDPWIVHVRAGIYTYNAENPPDGEIFPIELRTDITLRGEDGAENCIISGEFNFDSPVPIIRGQNVSGIIIKDLTFKDMARTGGSRNGGAIELISCSGTIENCIVENNLASYGSGIWLSLMSSSSFTVSECLFSKNGQHAVTVEGGGIYVSGSYNGSISRNTFSENQAKANGAGIFVSGELNGNVSNNTFNSNYCNAVGGYHPKSSGGGFFVAGKFTGNVSRNVFHNNYCITDGMYNYSYGGGFRVKNDFSGSIHFNIFSSGYTITGGGGFYIDGIFIGEITGNTFTRNSSTAGAGFYLSRENGNVEDVLVSNNHFFYNWVGNDDKGSGLYANSNATILNNTFHGGYGNDTAVHITQNAESSILINNIFENLYGGVWEEGETDVSIAHNDFFNVNHILFRNDFGWGSDPFFVYLGVLGFENNNHDWPSGIVGEDADIGAWTQNAVYDPVNNFTTLTDSIKKWETNRWSGAMLNLSGTRDYRHHFPIVRNNETQIMVQGNIAVMGLGVEEEYYSIDDYHLSVDSQNVDAGNSSNVTVDFEGDLRPQETAFDIGADEFVYPDSIPINTITATSGSDGSVSPEGDIHVRFGKPLQILIKPDSGYHIDDVLVDGVSVGPVSVYTFPYVTEDHTIHALFDISEEIYTITASAAPGGIISPPGNVSVASEAGKNFTVEPISNYEVVDVLVDNFSVGAVTEYAFSGVTENHTIHASFNYVGSMEASTISVQVSTNSITIGEYLQISGLITPPPTQGGAFVDISLVPPSGPEIHRTVVANSLGEFIYDVACRDINSFGTWSVRAIWTGDPMFSGATSEDQTFDVEKSQIRVILDVTSQAIKLGEDVSLSGKFTPQPDCGRNLTNIPVTLTISGPGGVQDIKEIYTSSRFGHFLVSDYGDFNALGEWTVRAEFEGDDAYYGSSSALIKVLVIETAGYAIVVQGKASSGEGLDSHNKTADFVYNQLIGRGVLHDDIEYFNYAYDPDPNVRPEIDASPTHDGIRDAIIQWAYNKLLTKPANLYIVMVDHGFDEVFKIYPDEITSSELGEWLNLLQGNLENNGVYQEIIVALGFCRSGSFIDDLSEQNRAILTSAGPGESSYKGPLDEDGIREGEYFLSEFFKSTSFGKSIKDAFQEAVILTEAFTAGNSDSSLPPFYDNALQHPLLDDNGDGFGSNLLTDSEDDGQLSADLYIGVSSVTGNDPGDVMVINVAETTFLSEEATTAALLWARVDDNGGFSTIWIEVKPPNFVPVGTGGTGQAHLNLTKTPTTEYHSWENRWEWEDVGGFSVPGTYQVFYFAKDMVSGNVTPLRQTKVYKALVDNQSPYSFSLISPHNNSKISTGVLLDWEDTSDPEVDNLTYTVLISKDDPSFSSPIRKENLTNSACVFSLSDGLEDLSTYYWKVIAIDQYGAMQVSDETWRFDTNNTNGIPGFVYVFVFDEMGEVINDTVIQPVNGTQFGVGMSMLILNSGTHTITVTVPGSEAKSKIIQVDDGKEHHLHFIFPAPLNGDIDGDGDVDGSDLAILASQFGNCNGDCSSDFDSNGEVNQDDLETLLEDFGL